MPFVITISLKKALAMRPYPRLFDLLVPSVHPIDRYIVLTGMFPNEPGIIGRSSRLLRSSSSVCRRRSRVLFVTFGFLCLPINRTDRLYGLDPVLERTNHGQA